MTQLYPIYRTTRHGGIDQWVGEQAADDPTEALAAWAIGHGVPGEIDVEGSRIIVDAGAQFIHYTYVA